MKSAFGVEHISKADKRLVPLLEKPEYRKIKKTDRKVVHEDIAPILPSTSVMAYNNSRANKTEAASRNLAARIIGSGLGLGAGYLGYRYGKGKVKFLNTPSKVKYLKKPISAEKKQGFTASAVTSAGAGAGGYLASRESLKNIKQNKRYRYEA